MPDLIANPGTSRSLVVQTTVNDSSAKTAINQIRGTDLKGSSGSGIPKQVTNVGASIANGATGSTSTVRVTFHRDPSDKNYSAAAVWVKGYQGNNNPVQVASSYESPATFVLNNTGEPVSVIVQSVGNGGQAPLSSAPTTGLTLPKSVSGGYGTSSTVYVNSVTESSGLTLKTPGLGFFIGPGITDIGTLFSNNNTSASITNTTANTVVVYQFVISDTWVLTSCSYKLVTASAGTHFNFGIYNSAGSKLIDCPFDGSLTTLQTSAFAAVTLAPGVYYFAASADSGLCKGPIFFSSAPSTVFELAALGAVHPYLATAANATSSNVLPSTLGALTAITSVAFWTGFPIPVWAV